jgi:hypothetical protein
VRHLPLQPQAVDGARGGGAAFEGGSHAGEDALTIFQKISLLIIC